MVPAPSSSDDEQSTNNLSKKELQDIERRRLKNKKKKESKKRREKEKDSGVESQTEKEAEKKDEPSEKVNGATTEAEKVKEEKIEQADEDLGIEIEYVGQDPTIDENDPNFAHFRAVFNAFKVDDLTGIKKEETAKPVKEIFRPSLDKLIPDEEKVDQSEKMSRRKLRLTLQPSIASLKESTLRPDVVEWADVTSRDPFLLVALKALRNTVPVPRHWNSKRKYLAGKRGFERTAFQLPDYIKRTGIQDMRDALLEKEDHQSLKSKMRERTRPKLGKINIDYQKLHDAFFKWQTKPPMTTMGELYYEGKEQETLMRDKKPGQLSDEIRIALGMPVGPTAFKFPPPWLIAMQRYGPPPSYPNMKIQGLSAPIPEGCSFGYHAGGWGKPPVDDYGKPLYGDVFGVELVSQIEPEDESRIERRYWGEIGSDESSEEESEDEIEEEEEKASGITTPMVADGGMVTPSGITTGLTGLETPETIELRKGRRDESVAGAETPAAAAYHIIPEKKVDRIGNQMMASTHVYDLSKKQAVRDDAVEVSLDPERIDLDQNNLQEYYDEGLRKQVRSEDPEEDLSDMIADHNAKQNRKRKVLDQKKQKEQQSGSSSSKKYKDFKF